MGSALFIRERLVRSLFVPEATEVARIFQQKLARRMYSQQIVRVSVLISIFCSGLFAIEGTHLRQWESKVLKNLAA
jgi:hypothetical protein